MNPTEIYDALSDLASQPYNASSFPYDFALATDAAKATIDRLRKGASNRSDLPGGVLLSRRFHFAPAGETEQTTVDSVLDQLKASSRNKQTKPAILLTTDGTMLAAFHPASGGSLHCRFDELAEHFGFFLPAAGKERYRAVEENPVDVKATGKLARLYDALIRHNPAWKNPSHTHIMNQFMMRLIFCLFSEDVGIFPKGQFTRLVLDYGGKKGEALHTVLQAGFEAMNLPQDERNHLPDWTAPLKYVNGGLFAGDINIPTFDVTAFRYLKDACELNWKDINPDIFGSMIQSVADTGIRAELGMHYTSVPNIRKVIDPLFLDGLRSDIQKNWDKPAALQKLLRKLGHIHIFDPACGSGNFLVIAYRQLRELEMTILQRLATLNGNDTMELFSVIPIANFHGIECADFAAETAKLALFIAEYQANAIFAEHFGRAIAPLPLREAAHIVCGNALRLDWDTVCPPPKAEDLVYIIGNPPFLGKQYQNAEQKADMTTVFSGSVKNYKGLDYVAAWYFKAARYIQGRQAEAALVATNSLCQGQAVNALWPDLLGEGLEISFAHTSFKWRNNASHNAAVTCIIVGLRNHPDPKTTAVPKRLFMEETEHQTQNINAYLLNAPDVFVEKASKSLFGLPEMLFGNMPADNGHLLLSPEERDLLLQQAPEAEPFIRRFMGSREAINDLERYCLWIDDAEIEQAKKICPISERIQAVRIFRQKSTRETTQSNAATPWRFGEVRIPASFSYAYLVPRVSSEHRPYLPTLRVNSDVISGDRNFVLYDAPEWCFALLVSRMHWVWGGTVCSRLETRFQYSNTLGWHTFPVPALTEADKEALKQSGRAIMRVRASYFDKSLADLYDPDKMPADLWAAHRANDALLEGLYNKGQAFTNDTQRLEHLFRRYAARVEQDQKKRTVRKKRSATKTQEG